MVGASSTCHSRVKTFEELPLEMTSHKTHHVRLRPQIYTVFIGWRMSTSAWFVCVYRTARQTVGWFWRQMSWRGLSTSTEEPCWKSRWIVYHVWLVSFHPLEWQFLMLLFSASAGRSTERLISSPSVSSSGSISTSRPPFFSQLSGQTFYNNEYGQLSEEGVSDFFSSSSDQACLATSNL